jgi:hypothetical protein
MNWLDTKDINITLRGTFVLLTNDYKKAILLEYFIIREENEGEWINASFPRISRESLLNLSIPAIKNYVNDLIKNNWISSRPDPKGDFGSSYQYKVNSIKLKHDIIKVLS